MHIAVYSMLAIVYNIVWDISVELFPRVSTSSVVISNDMIREHFKINIE